MMMQNKDQHNVEEKITLRDFLIKEHTLISSLGVFIALTIFSASFLKGIVGDFLSLLFLLLSILIFFELWKQFPKTRGSTKLALFESYLSIGSILLFAFWLSQLRKIDEESPIFILSVLLYGPIMTFISTIIKKFALFNKLFRVKESEKKFLRYVFGYILMIIVFFGIYIFLSFLKDYINRFLDLFIS